MHACLVVEPHGVADIDSTAPATLILPFDAWVMMNGGSVCCVVHTGRYCYVVKVRINATLGPVPADQRCDQVVLMMGWDGMAWE